MADNYDDRCTDEYPVAMTRFQISECVRLVAHPHARMHCERGPAAKYVERPAVDGRLRNRLDFGLFHCCRHLSATAECCDSGQRRFIKVEYHFDCATGGHQSCCAPCGILGAVSRAHTRYPMPGKGIVRVGGSVVRQQLGLPSHRCEVMAICDRGLCAGVGLADGSALPRHQLMGPVRSFNDLHSTCVLGP